MKTTIRLAFRFDDPSPVSKRHVEKSVLAELGKRQLLATFAVVPFRIISNQEKRFDEERASHLLEGLHSGSLEIALHGCFHRDLGCAKDREPSEFNGVPRNQQLQYIRRGKEELERLFGPVISGFIPPWNSYDSHTMCAVQSNGLSYISASYRAPPNTALPVLPATCKLRQLQSAVLEARHFLRFEPVIIVGMHHYDFDRDNGDPPGLVHSYQAFGDLLDWIADQPDIEVLTLRELSEKMLGDKLRWPTHLRLRSALTWRLKHWLPEYCFLNRYFLPDIL